MSYPKPPMTAGSAAMLVTLTILGFLGNYYSLPLFFGADFLFGSIAVMLILYFYGLGYGVIAAIIINIYCYFLWGHPYGSLNFILEALFVGCLLRSGRKNLFLLDGAFWIFIGVPLVILELGVALHMGATLTSFIMLKQSINGMFNALLATLCITYLPLDKILDPTQPRRTFSLHETLFNLLAALALFPALVLTVIGIHHEMNEIERNVVAELRGVSADVQSHLNFWYLRHLHAVTELAIAAGKSTMLSSTELQRHTEVLRQAFPDLVALHVENAQGTVITFAPMCQEKPGFGIGLNFADRVWFKEARAQRRPFLSEVFIGNRAVFSPIVSLAVPILREQEFWGTASASVNLNRLGCILEPYKKFWGVNLTLTDSHGHIIASTLPTRRPLGRLDSQKIEGSQLIQGAVYHQFPPDEGLPSMTRWQQSFYVQETRVSPEIPWTLILEAPVSPHQKQLYAIYIQNLSIMALLIVCVLLLAPPLSRWLANPLEKLAKVTSDMPYQLKQHRDIDWPESSANEMAVLINNFQSMALILEQNFEALEARGEELARANEELRREFEEREQAEKSLRESEQRFRDITENASEWIWEVDAAGKYTYSNPIAEKLLGFPLEVILTKHFYDFFHPDDREELKQAAFAAFAQKLPFRDFINRNINAQGEIVWVLTSGVPLLDDHGNFLGYRGADRDITSRRQTEAALRESEMKYRLVVENLPAVVFKGYADWRTEFFDEKVAELTGYDKDEFNSGRLKWSDVIVKEDLQTAKEAVRQALKGNKLYAREYRIIRQGGDIIWIQARGQIVCDQDGRIDHINGVFFDITDRKKAEEEWIKLSKLESLGLLAGGIAHDFNNILTGILGNLSLCLLERAVSPEMQERLMEAEKACEQARALSRQLLTFAKGGAPIKEITAIDKILGESALLACRGTQSRCEFHLAPDLWAVEIDAGQMNQVFQNIVINAVQAMPLGGTIKIYGENVTIEEDRGLPLKPGNYVKIVIQDQGLGIPAEYLTKIFDPYFTTKQKGSGLGLATSYSIVKNHNGHLAVDSTLEKGSAFTIYLPGLDRKITPPPQEPEELIKRTGSILVMDDEMIVQKVLGKMLVSLGYDVTFALDGEEAINIFTAAQASGHNFDAVILDLTVPGGMGGKETLEKLLSLDPHVKAIVSSGYFDDSVMAEFKKYGFSGVICKPYTLAELGKTLSQVITGARPESLSAG
ncbi:MAG: PAS domain S-box protein [Desulfobaccales bacterium]